MSARFISNFVILVLGAVLAIFVFATGRDVSDWVAVAVGATSVAMAMYSFASVDQGIYQRVADVFIAAFGAWAIVAARVMNYQGHWLVLGAALALLILGAVGLLVREIRLSGGLQVGGSRIGPDQFATISALQRSAETTEASHS